MIDGMKWLLLSMLVSLGRGRSCDVSNNCSCQAVSYWTWEIRCPSGTNPKFIARYGMNPLHFRVECHNVTSWSEFGFLSTLPLDQSWPSITIERCPLPDESFDHDIKIFGFQSAKYLTFTSHMNLNSTLTRRHFSMLSALETLNLSSNGLTELASDLFRDVGNLRQLDLSFNEIAMLPSDIFDESCELESLNLSYNAVKFVDWRLFNECWSLNRLSLRGNRLTSLDYRTFRRTGSLKVIDLADNLLETLPPHAFEFSTELELDISGNRFSTLPEELYSGIGLTGLTLAHNRGNLTALPMDFFNHLYKLKKVILKRNNLTYLPENIFWGSYSVQSIDLHGNALTELPYDIFKELKALIFLDLSENRLDYVPIGPLRWLSKLQELNLARNRIAVLHSNTFVDLYSLLDLNLGFNKITKIHWTAFYRLPNIRLIRLSHNFVHLERPNFLRLGKYFYGRTIQKIFLDHNDLSGWLVIETAIHSPPSNLELVDLTHNQISLVMLTNPLIGSHDVEYDLRHNNLSDIYIRDEISSAVSILVDHNPLDCGCTIYDPLKYMHKIREPRSGENVKIILGNASCNEPFWMMATIVDSLQLETFTCRPDNKNLHVRCAEGCDCWWRPHDRTRIVDCSSRNVTGMPEQIIGFVNNVHNEYDMVLFEHIDPQTQWIHWRNSRIELDLANNSLTEISLLSVSGYEYVETLILSHNHISKLSFNVLPPRLETLHLDHNDLKKLDWVASNALFSSASLKRLNFEGNQWGCDADTRKSLRMMENKLGPNLRYSFKTCLDFRNPPNTKEAPATYISYTFF